MTDVTIAEDILSERMVRLFVCSPKAFNLSLPLCGLSRLEQFAGSIDMESLPGALNDDPSAQAVIVYSSPDMFASYVGCNELQSSLSRWLAEIEAMLRVVRQYRNRIILVAEPDIPDLLGQLGLNKDDIAKADWPERYRDPVLTALIYRMLSCFDGREALVSELEARTWIESFEAPRTPDRSANEILAYRKALTDNSEANKQADILKTRTEALEVEVDRLRQELLEQKDVLNNANRYQYQASVLEKRLERAEQARDAMRGTQAEKTRQWQQERQNLTEKMNDLWARIEDRDHQIRAAHAEIERIFNSRSFRMTAIFRRSRSILSRGLRRNG